MHTICASLTCNIYIYIFFFFHKLFHAAITWTLQIAYSKFSFFGKKIDCYLLLQLINYYYYTGIPLEKGHCTKMSLVRLWQVMAERLPNRHGRARLQ